eukprot:TRINITY_DN1283_c0_g3_i2.p1 TRINITY_DN1283_c0_g3~~TRINITY_DN1283_c0_g3_i2.p1  ORF type:complete len:285 (-),score=101.97 TRINITY_DN1283_c0_g3_i2:716-1570(-)
MKVEYIEEDLVDALWQNKPAPSKNPVMIHEVKYSGKSTEEKLKMIREIMDKQKTNAIVISALDEIAWILNLRGSDIDFNPYFISYLLITLDKDSPQVTLYSDPDKFKDEKIQKYLADIKVKLLPYESIKEGIEKLNGMKVAIECDSTNAKIFSLVEAATKNIVKLGDELSLLKQQKNETELKGYRECHIRDGVGLVKYLAWLEHQLNVLNRTDLSEYEGAEQVLRFRQAQHLCMGLSFATISSIGPNASVVHYEPEKDKCAIINNKEVYLLDSGAHYLYCASNS